MSWWSKARKALLMLGGTIALVCVVLILLRLFGPRLTNSACTLADCFGNGIHVNIIGGSILEEYSVEVEFPDGKRLVECNASSSQRFTNMDGCEDDSVFFKQPASESPLDSLPEEITIIVITDGKRISKTFDPDYRVMYPNGENCAPKCYFVSIDFDLSQ